jgi:peptidase E
VRLLLGSGGLSTEPRREVWRAELGDFLGSAVTRLLFVPYALADHDATLARLSSLALHAGRELVGLHRAGEPRRAVEEAQALFVGGGNSFRLLDRVQRLGLLGLIRERVRGGMPYVGISAGTNLACPTIRTTNDMPIVQPVSLDALGLVPFQINPHWFDGPIHVRHGEGFLPYGGRPATTGCASSRRTTDPSWRSRRARLLRVEGRPRPCVALPPASSGAAPRPSTWRLPPTSPPARLDHRP